MNPMQDVKFVAVTSPVAIVDAASWTTNSIDTLGFRYLTVVCQFGAMDIAATALKLQTSDTDSSYADYSGANFSTGTLIDGTGAALPSATDDNKFFVFEVDLTKNGAKRYWDLVATGGDGSTGAYMSAFAILSKSEVALTTSSARGAAGVIRV